MIRPRLARLVAPASIGALLVSLATIPAAVSASPATPPSGVEVSAAVRHDVSPPLRNLRPAAPSAANLRERPLLRTGGPGANGPDGALQTTTGPSIATTTGLSFAGIGQGDYGFSDQYAPPDTNGAVGATQYVQWVNTDFAVFNKSNGALIIGPVPGNTMWSGFGGGCETNNDGDPIVQYDKTANRWIFTQFSVSTTPYLQCVAVSTTSDATGSYYRYAFSFGSTAFPDYPKLGVWPDGYYMSFNIFNNGSTWAGARACALDRNAMLTGNAATMQCFQLSTAYPSLLPSDLDGTTAPPAGSPDFFLDYGTNSLNLWKFHVDWTTPANTTFGGPTSIPVAAFSAACGGGTCIPQPSTRQKLDSLADRLMYRLAYRNFGDHEALVVNQSVAAGTSTGIRWYELRNPSGSTMAAGTPYAYQQGTYAPDSSYRWMGSIAMDGAGDIAVGYSVSSSTLYPSIRYTGRVPTDTLGSLETETTVQAGSGSQLQNLSRWGDYSAMSVDPTDDCTFWYTNEYLKSSGTFNWSTWITSFKFPGCGTTPATGTLTGTVTDTSTAAAISGATVTVSGGPSTTTAADGSYSMSVAGGTYSVTASANGYNSSTQSATITNGSTTTLPFTLTPTSGGSSPPGPPGTPTASPGPGKGITVTWSAPTVTGSSAITGYQLNRYVQAGSGTCSTTASPATISLGNVLSYKDTGTTRGSYYCYTVAAINAAGTGSASAPSNVVKALK